MRRIFKDLGQAKVKSVEADFLLTATISEMKQPAPPAKLAGGIKRFGSLVSPNDGATILASSASGKTGGNTLNVRGAISLASTVGTMMMFGPMGPNMLRGNLGGMGAYGGGADPSLTTNPTGENDQSKAVEVAIADMVKTVLAHPRP